LDAGADASVVAVGAGDLPGGRAGDPHARRAGAAQPARAKLLRAHSGVRDAAESDQQVAGRSEGNVWKPALLETDEGLVPAFIIETFDDGRRCTVFVPSIPTPFAGAVYVLESRRVHPLDVPFTQALNTVSRWGSGAKDLVAAMEKTTPTPTPTPSLPPGPETR
jgi:hypothetical protein